MYTMRWSPYKKHRRLCRKCISFFFSHIRCFLGNKVNIPFIFTAFMPQSCFEFSRNPMNFTTSTSFNMKSMLVSLFCSLPITHSRTHTHTNFYHWNENWAKKSLIHKWVRVSEYLCTFIRHAYIHTQHFASFELHIPICAILTPESMTKTEYHLTNRMAWHFLSTWFFTWHNTILPLWLHCDSCKTFPKWPKELWNLPSMTWMLAKCQAFSI